MRTFKRNNEPMANWPRVATLPHAREVLEQLHPDWTLVLATNAADSTEVEIRTALGRGRIAHLLDQIYCFQTVGHKKPTPKFFQYIMQDLNIPVKHTIMVGDNYQTDIVGAAQSNIRGIWFNQTESDPPAPAAFAVIKSLEELPHALAYL